jgi:ribosome biogenesis GTPase
VLGLCSRHNKRHVPDKAPEKKGSLLRGLVLTYHSNVYQVQVPPEPCSEVVPAIAEPSSTENKTTSGLAKLYYCLLKATLKKAGETVRVGDWVQLDSVDEATQSARIVAIEPRKNELRRPAIANISQVLVLLPWQHPAFDSRQLDRLLTHVHLAGLPVCIGFSKVDLATSSDALPLADALARYRNLGYPVLALSIFQPESLKALEAALAGQTTVLAGPSGAGKSSLLNALQPGLALRVNEVSAKLARGQHTTRSVQLLQLTLAGQASYVADSPGFSQLQFEHTPPQAIATTFPELAPLQEQCGFRDCLHRGEASCQLDLNRIHPERYQQYLVLVEEAEASLLLQQATSNKREEARKAVGGGVEVLRLQSKQRAASRRQAKQHLKHWQDGLATTALDDATLSDDLDLESLDP